MLGYIPTGVALTISCASGRAVFAFAAAIAGTWIFVCFIQRIQFKDVVMVPLVGIMFGNVIGGVTSYLPTNTT